MVASVGLLALGALGALLPDETVLAIGAALKSPDHAEGSCMLCGMTRSFVCISHGDFGAAAQWNRGAVPLIGAILVNGTLALGIAFRRTLATIRGRNAPSAVLNSTI